VQERQDDDAAFAPFGELAGEAVRAHAELASLYRLEGRVAVEQVARRAEHRGERQEAPDRGEPAESAARPVCRRVAGLAPYPRQRVENPLKEVLQALQHVVLPGSMTAS
jgi:hypothetical protein